MMPAWHQLVPISGHVEESETARKLQLYATSIKTSVSTRLNVKTVRNNDEPSEYRPTYVPFEGELSKLLARLLGLLVLLIYV